MADIKKISGDMQIKNARFVLVASRFNSFIVDHLVQGALDVLVRHGAEAKKLEVVYAPGAFEIPLVVKRIAQTQRCDAIIALGAVIRGATPHFDYVAGECVKGIASVMMETGIPVAFGVLTVDTIEQAIERAGTKAGNKGAEAAMSAIEMVNLLREIDSAKP